MNPLEDVVVALQPLKQTLPWPLPDSIRSLDVTMKDGTPNDPTISGIDPATGNAIASPFAPGFLGTSGTMNEPVNFGWEYVWHCHILGHEENDMMRPMVFQVAPPAPSNLTATANTSGGVTVSWIDNSASETSFTLQRDTDPNFLTPAPTSFTIDVNTAGSNFNTVGFGGTVTFVDSNVSTATIVYYRVQAVDDFTPTSPLQPPFQTVPMMSAWVGPVPFSAAPIAVVTPKALNFGNVLVGSTAGPQSITLSNTGTAVLNISGLGLTGKNPGDFALPASTAPCGATLDPGANCTIDVTFTPTAVGARAAFVTITSNDPVNGTLNVPLTGAGTANTATAITLAAPS